MICIILFVLLNPTSIFYGLIDFSAFFTLLINLPGCTILSTVKVDQVSIFQDEDTMEFSKIWLVCTIYWNIKLLILP